ncbi:MAG: TIGR03067 domain-containing protein [Isosphaeraceae bacterium]
MMNILLSCAVAGLVLSAAPQSPARRDLDALQGTWVAVSMERNGRPLPANRYQDGRLVMDGETFTYFDENRVATRGIRTLDPTQTPCALDDLHTVGPFKGKTYHGIYRLQGDTFTTCNGSAGSARPTGFATRPGTGLLLIVYKRAKP